MTLNMDTNARPLLSVIVPTFNRIDQLRRCLQALLAQDVDPAQYEIIIVVDGSTDGTENILIRTQARCLLRVLSQANCGPASARNRGLGLAQGHIVAFVDDDMVVDKGFVRAHLAAHQRHPNSAIVGSVGIVAGRVIGTALATFRTLQNLQNNLLADSRLESPFDLIPANFSIQRHLLLSLDGFDTSLPACEDFDLGLRLLQVEVPIWYCCEAKSTEIYSRGVELVTRDAYRRGIAHGIIAKKHARAAVLLDFQRFFHGNPITRVVRVAIWHLAPALSPLMEKFVALGPISRGIAWAAEQPIMARIIGGVMYWSGLQGSIGTIDELRRLAKPSLR